MVAPKHKSKVTSTLKVSNDSFSGLPMGFAETVQESTEMIDCKDDVQSSANQQVHEGTN